MTFLGYIAAIFIGLFLGLLGGGGSILSVPVLRYMFELSADSATGYSLFVVGVASLLGSFSYFKGGLIDFKALALFGGFASVSAFVNRKFVIPEIPTVLTKMGSFTLTKDFAIMALFAIVMVLSSISMIKNKEEHELKLPLKRSSFGLALIGLLVGLFTSLVGAGGGFIVVPALSGFYGMPIKVAIGTSLSIITINSLAGFTGSALTDTSIDWSFLLGFTVLACLGIFAGVYLSKKIAANKLKPAFGWFVASMSVFILLKEWFI